MNFHNYHHRRHHHHQANATAYEDVQALIRINNVRVCWWEERGATVLCASLYWASAQSHRSPSHPSQLVGDFSNREAYSPLHSKLHRSLFNRSNSIDIFIFGFHCLGCPRLKPAIANSQYTDRPFHRRTVSGLLANFPRGSASVKASIPLKREYDCAGRN